MLKTIQEQLQQALEQQNPQHPISAELKNSKGLNIYIEGYMARLTEAVQSDFEVTCKILNDDSLIETFVKSTFPKHYSLFDYTKDFPNFLTTTCLSELARFELNLSHSGLLVHRAEKENPKLTLQEGMVLQLCSSVILFESEFPVDNIYEDEKLYEKKQTKLVIWNSNFTSYYKPLSDIEYRLFKAFKTHEHMDGLLSEFTFQELQVNLQSFIAEWTAKNVFL